MDLKELLKSEGHEITEEKLQNLNEAQAFLLQRRGNDIDHEFIISLHGKVTGKRVGYSSKIRCTSFKGKIKVFSSPHEVIPRMKALLQQLKKSPFLIEDLVEFIVEFLEIHPFYDANGRTLKLMLWFIIQEMYGRTHYEHIEYDEWCEILYYKQKCKLQAWLRKHIKI